VLDRPTNRRSARRLPRDYFSTDPTHKWAKRVVKNSLHRTPDQVPDARLLIDNSGALYGAGTKLTRHWSDKGEVYKLAPKSGAGEWEWSTIHKFSGPDGFMPKGTLVMDKAGAIYGAASSGGEGKCWEGCGTVFKLTPPSDIEHDWRLTVLYKFSDQDHGLIQPQTGVVLGNDGSLYGSASGGGADCRGNGCGGVFKLSPPANGTGAWAMSTLYIFHADTNDFPRGHERRTFSGCSSPDRSDRNALQHDDIWWLGGQRDAFQASSALTFAGSRREEPSGAQR
jgi:hypothetical protein